MTLRVTRLAAAEIEEAARVLGRAFRDNPMNRAVIGRDALRRERVNAIGAAVYLPAALEGGLVLAARCGERIDGVLIGLAPSAFPLPMPRWRDGLRLLRGQGFRIARRFGLVAAELRALHPPGPHWTLSTLGVEPVMQRRGVGLALVGALLAEASADGVPVYLDTDRAENVAFYERAGFELQGESLVHRVRVFRLLRPAIGPG